MNQKPYQNVRVIFLIVFIFALAGTLYFALFRIPHPPEAPDQTSFALTTSIVTTVISLAGFVSTTALSWRKEKREAELAELERRKLQAELEKSRLGAERIKKKAAKTAKPKPKKRE